MLFAVATSEQRSKARNRAVSDCGSTIASLSDDIDLSPNEDNKQQEQQPHTTLVPCAPPSKVFFPEVLMDMLNNNQRFASIISWKPDGKSFVIKSRHEFKEKVLPLYFQSNFDSFLRKLKRWGFEKDKVRRRGGPSIEFSQKYFHRDDSGLCLRMHCKSGPGAMTEDSSFDAHEEQQPKVVDLTSSPPGDDNGAEAMRQKSALVDHLLKQQATQKRLLEQINKAALAEKLAAFTAGRRERTFDQAPMPTAEQLMNQRQLLMRKQLIVAAMKAQLARKLSAYMSAPHPHRQQQARNALQHETKRDFHHLSQMQRLGQVLDDNARHSPMSGSTNVRTQHSREALRLSILAKRRELGLPPSVSTQSLLAQESRRFEESNNMRFEESNMTMEPRSFHQLGAANTPGHNVGGRIERINFFGAQR